MTKPDDKKKPEWCSDAQPIPVIRMTNFLPEEERDALFNAVCANKAVFQRSGGIQSETLETHYLSLGSGDSDAPAVTAIRKSCESLSAQIHHRLPAIFSALSIDPFSVKRIPMTLVNGGNGHYGSPHTDESGGRYQISLLYYVHKKPKAFSGGDLVFYKTDSTSPCGYSNEEVARVEHEDNLLVAFPSTSFHGVTEVRCDSSEFEDGRLAIVGFLGSQ